MAKIQFLELDCLLLILPPPQPRNSVTLVKPPLTRLQSIRNHGSYFITGMEQDDGWHVTT